MNDNRALGRGLSALIRDSSADASADAEHGAPQGGATKYQEIAISQIDGNPNQPRRSFDDESLAELADSISAAGLVQPVIVRRSGDRYELIAGERRWRAAARAGIDRIPAIIREADDGESLELALIENISREDLNPMDTARAYANLQEDFGITQEQLAEKLGRSRSAVANTMRLLELPDEVQELIEAGRLSEGHGRALLSLGDRLTQRKLAGRMASGGMSVRQAEALVKRQSGAGAPAGRTAVPPVSQELMDEATDALYSAFQLPARARWTGKRGRIELEFRDKQQLQQLIERLGDA